MLVKLINIVCLLLFMMIPTIHAMHVYQQQHYQIDRYVVWLHQQVRWNRLSLKNLFYYIPFLGISISSNLLLFNLLILIDTYLAFKVEHLKIYSKNIVYTNRIKRLFIFMLLIEFLLAFLSFTFLTPTFIILIAPLSYLLPWGLLLIAASSLMPLEEGIRDYYRKDAQALLEANKQCKVIGITGSYGKTSTKNMAYHILSNKYHCLMTQASYNNKMGITLSIRNYLKPYHECFICEIGGDHMFEIEDLAQFVNPSIAIITSVGPQHLQTFGSIQNILEEKMKLVEHLPKSGIAICNRDNDYIRNYRIKNNCRKIWFGIYNLEVDYRACNIKYSETGTSFDVVTHLKTYSFKTKLLGEHNVLNLLAGIALGDLLTIPFEEMIETVKRIPYVLHRLEVIKNKDYTILDNSYNSNPVSAKYALDVLSRMQGRKIIITPGFIDLGEDENYENRKLGRMIAVICDEVILVGKHQSHFIMKGLIDEQMAYEKVHVVNNRNEAFNELIKISKKGDFILVENDLPDAYVN
ncbi:MAG: UDP-N-acetylmuramoyl-tripeptide--D-alanyl-D-alanine ligase [Erysipelotrichaceae bacterium]